MQERLVIIQSNLLESYLKQIPSGLHQAFDDLHDAELSTSNFSFYTSVSSVFSSKIEGEIIELDSFVKHRRDGIPFQIDYTRKIDDLYDVEIFSSKWIKIIAFIRANFRVGFAFKTLADF